MAANIRLDWSEKYRPKSLSQLKGIDKAILAIRKWASAWEAQAPVKKGLILAGKSGTGKTSAAFALANDFNWGIIELNASDARNAESIRSVALVGSINETFTAAGEFVSVQSGGRKLIILDEADNLFERMSRTETADKDMGDRGGKAAIIETLKKTHQPIILIVNDLYELTRDSGAVIKQLSEVVKFPKLRQPTVRLVLKQICDAEGVEITTDALDELSRRADGDLRSGVNDLQMLAEGTKKITFEQLKALGYRNVRATIFDAVRDIFKSTDTEHARKATWDLDESPEDIILWVDENLPLEYRRPLDLMNGFNRLSKADVFIGRVRRRQYYGLWAYANDLMTAGIALAKHDRYHGWVKYQFPTWLLKMSRTKQVRQLKRETSKKIGGYCHTSKKVVASDILPYFRYIFKTDHSFAINMSNNLDFTKEEISWLLEEKTMSNKVKYLLSEIKKAQERTPSDKIDNAPEIFSSGQALRGISEPETVIKEVEDDEPQPILDLAEDEKNKDDEKKKQNKKVQKNLFDY